MLLGGRRRSRVRLVGRRLRGGVGWGPGEAYRSAAARISYIAQDHLDIQYASKEACRTMAKPAPETGNASMPLADT